MPLRGRETSRRERCSDRCCVLPLLHFYTFYYTRSSLCSSRKVYIVVSRTRYSFSLFLREGGAKWNFYIELFSLPFFPLFCFVPSKETLTQLRAILTKLSSCTAWGCRCWCSVAPFKSFRYSGWRTVHKDNSSTQLQSDAAFDNFFPVHCTRSTIVLGVQLRSRRFFPTFQALL